jgi:hypothetical protein
MISRAMLNIARSRRGRNLSFSCEKKQEAVVV